MMFSKAKRQRARLDNLMSVMVDATVGIYVSIINRLAFDAIRRRSGVAPPTGTQAAMETAKAAIEHVGWTVSEPELLASFYQEVLVFNDRQLGYEHVAERLSGMSADPPTCRVLLAGPSPHVLAAR